MPIDFETNFVKPFLLDLGSGAITDADTFCGKISQYYENTVMQGQPQNITPTIVSPTLTSAASGVPTNAVISNGVDGIIKPNSVASQQKMYQGLSKYYVARELLLAENDIKASIDTLDAMIRKQQFNIKRVIALTKKAEQIKTQIKELPTKIKDFVDLAQALLEQYRVALDTIKRDTNDGLKNYGIDKAKLADVEIIEVIKNLKFNDIRNVIESLQKIQRYIQLQQQTKRFTSTTYIVSQIKELAQAIVTPEQFGGLIARVSSDVPEIKTKIERAKQSYKDFKVIQTDLQPALRLIESEIKELIEKGKTRIKEMIQDEKDHIEQRQIEKRQKKKPSEKKQLFAKARTDIKDFQKENAEEFQKLARKQKIIADMIKKTTSIVSKSLLIKDTIIQVEIPFIKEKLTEYYSSISGSIASAASVVSGSRADVQNIKIQNIKKPENIDKEITQYFSYQKINEIAQPFVAIAAAAKINFQDFRILVESRSKRFDLYIDQLKAIKEDFLSLQTLAQQLDDEKVTFRYPRENEEQRKERALKKLNRKRVVKKRPTHSMVSVLKAISIFVQKVAAWMKKQAEKVKKFIIRQLKKLQKIAINIGNAIIDLIPLKNSDAKTKKEARKEKIDKAKAFNAKLKIVRDKTMALVQVSAGGSAVVLNIAAGKYSFTDNEAHLRKIAEGKYQYEIIGLEGGNPQISEHIYREAQSSRQKFLENIDVLKTIDQYVVLIIKVIQAIKEGELVGEALNVIGIEENFGKNFIQDLKTALDETAKNTIGKQGDNNEIGLVTNLKTNAFVSIVEEFFGGDPTFNSIISAIRKLRTELRGQVATSLIKSANTTQALVQLESKYLYKVQELIRKMLGYLSEQNDNPLFSEDANQPATPTNTDPTTTAGKTRAQIRKFVKEQKTKARGFTLGKYNPYDDLVYLDKLITKRQGSFLAALIDRLMVSLSEFEQFIRKEFKEFITGAKEYLAGLAKKYYDDHQVELDAIKEKLLNAEAGVLSSVFGLSARVFWTGATWQNSFGTIFQIVTISKFPRLTKNGFVDGGEEYIREIAENFQKQLDGMVGIVYPAPQYGILPFRFKGYK